MTQDKRPDIPIDPQTTELVGRGNFKAPRITPENVDAFVKLDELGKQGLPPAVANDIKKQASEMMLKGLCQEERKRCFMAFAAFFGHTKGVLTRQGLLAFMNEFEIDLLTESRVNAVLDQAEAVQQLAAAPQALPEKTGG